MGICIRSRQIRTQVERGALRWRNDSADHSAAAGHTTGTDEGQDHSNEERDTRQDD
jgi:hypothetical protein